MLGEALLELDVPVVWVAVDAVGRCQDCGPHAGQRAVDGLVAGDLDRAGHRLAGGVGGEVGQFGAETGGHPKQSRGVRDAALPSAVCPVYASSSAVLGIASVSGTLGIGQEACQSGRMGLTANELSVLKRTGGSNPLASATADSLH